jgi:hypothetical protein
MNLVGWFRDIAAGYQADTAMPPLAPLDPSKSSRKNLRSKNWRTEHLVRSCEQTGIEQEEEERKGFSSGFR